MSDLTSLYERRWPNGRPEGLGDNQKKWCRKHLTHFDWAEKQAEAAKAEAEKSRRQVSQ